MKYDAIIFDLFGTLVDNFSSEEFNRVLSEMAELLHAPQEEFMHMWQVDTWPQRAIGLLSTAEAAIEYVCHSLGISVGDTLVRSAAEKRLDFTRRTVVPRHDTIETLNQLKLMGYKIGLISDCTAEVPLLWHTTPLAALINAPIFSCSVGFKKPDPRIYRLASEQLGVAPERCLYVGDGGSYELTGAINAGMQALLIRVPYEDTYDIARLEAEDWQGAKITTVKDVLAFVV